VKSKNGDTHVINRQDSALAKTLARALIALAAVGSLVVLLDAGAKYSGLAWRAASLARVPSALEQEVTATGFTPRDFRLSANLPLGRAPNVCTEPEAAPESPSGDGAFDNTCVATTTVKAVGEFPGAELLSWPGDWLYHRTVRF
jgi:hypothetical protein